MTTAFSDGTLGKQVRALGRGVICQRVSISMRGSSYVPVVGSIVCCGLCSRLLVKFDLVPLMCHKCHTYVSQFREPNLNFNQEKNRKEIQQ